MRLCEFFAMLWNAEGDGANQFFFLDFLRVCLECAAVERFLRDAEDLRCAVEAWRERERRRVE